MAAMAIVKPDGNPVAIHVMDGALLISFEVSASKAYTAVALKMSTEDLNPLVQPGQMFYGLERIEGTKILAIGGGVLLTKKGEVVGALGVSGGTDKEDIAIANYGKEVFEHGI